ncbi:MAG TPA: helix-turn-helix transcriptional regulator [Castellaniella sp.]|uniref:helix-turn-helix domain-containing protein n=1 Tax=Castellaniella sp. TaxID=1955812 RepID=UPI002F20A5D4
MPSADTFHSTIDYAALGERLRAYRIGAALQAEDVADQLGISRAAVYRMEKGEIVKIETLERVAALLRTTLASLLGAQVEYYANALGLFERMRQLEHSADSIFVHFEPVSLLLASDAYPALLREMLMEVTARRAGGAITQDEVDAIIHVIEERRAAFRRRRPQVVGLVGMHGLERFLQIGMVGRVRLSDSVRQNRLAAARREIARVADLMASEPLNVRIGLVDDAMPASTFEFFAGPSGKAVATSPFRLGELPNVRNGIATVTSAPEAIEHYEDLTAKLWKSAYKGAVGAGHLQRLLDRL